MAPEQEPDVELKFPVSVFSMLNTSWITHHYPTGLALRAALSPSSSLALRLSLSLWCQLSWRKGWDMGRGLGEPHSADVKCEVELTCCVQNISQV